MVRLRPGVVVVLLALWCASAVRAAPPTTKPASAARPPAPRGQYEQAPLVARPAASQSSASAAATTQSTTAVPTGSAAPIGMDVPRVALGLAAVLALIFVLRWVARWAFPSVASARPTSAMRVLSRTAVSPKQQLLLVQVGKRVLVVGDSAGQLRGISEIAEPNEAAALVAQITEEQSRSSTKAFGSLFGRAKNGFEARDEAPAQQGDSRGLLVDDGDDEQDAQPILAGLSQHVRRISDQFRR
jgi:flagellar biogenesis protein FliO